MRVTQLCNNREPSLEGQLQLIRGFRHSHAQQFPRPAQRTVILGQEASASKSYAPAESRSNPPSDLCSSSLLALEEEDVRLEPRLFTEPDDFLNRRRRKWGSFQVAWRVALVAHLTEVV